MSVASKEVAKDVVPVTPEYWAQACAHLAKKDRVMKKLIPQFGDAILETRGDAFVTLARSIVGQQISVKAAQSVWAKFSALSIRKIAEMGWKPTHYLVSPSNSVTACFWPAGSIQPNSM